MMKIRHLFTKQSLCLVLAAAFAVAPLAASAQSVQPRLQGMSLSNDQPIQIESDQLEIQEQDKQAVFTGNVKVVQGETTLQSGSMVVHYAGGGNNSVASGSTDIERIVVNDRVLISTPTQTASAERGSFDMASQVAVLEGEKVVLTEGENVFIGCRLTVHMETGEAKLDSCGGRVRIQLDPKSQNKN